MEFKEKIKQLRKQKGLSQKEIADLSRINQASYSNIESGTTKKDTIKLGVAKDIAKALGVSFNELFEIEIPTTINETDFIIENERLKKENERLEEHLEDKRKRTFLYEDTTEFLALCFSNGLAALAENEDISASELIHIVKKGVVAAKGQRFVTAIDGKGLAFKFITQEESDLLEAGVKAMNRKKTE
jgi:transcriptional regulator with XRE-family HTH domain